MTTPPSRPDGRPKRPDGDDETYAALGEAEAAILGLNPADPHTFEVAFKNPHPDQHQHHQSLSDDGAHPSSTRASRNAARRLQHELEARLQNDQLNRLAAIQQNVLQENPSLTDEIARHVHVGHEALAGSTAAVVSRLCVAPLDVLKIRFQIQEQQASHRQYTSVLQAFKTIYQKEGILAFWKGNAAAEIMGILYGGASFIAYSSCKSWFPTPERASYQHIPSLVAGSFSGFCATISTYPLDLLRTRFAAQQEHKVYRSLWHAAKHIWSREGFGGFYVGMAPTLIGIVPLMAVQFGSYEAMRQAIRNAKTKEGDDPAHTDLTFIEQSLTGFTAGVLSKFITMPFDVVKKRFQVSGFEMPSYQVRAAKESTHAYNTNVTSAPHAAGTPRPVAPIAVPHATAHVTDPSVLSHTHPSSTAPSASAAAPLSSTSTLSSSRLTSSHSSAIARSTVPSMPPPATQTVKPPTTTTAPPPTGASIASVAPPSTPPRRRRRHDQPVAGRRPFTGVWDCARGIYAHEGVHGLFKGSIPSVMKAGPNSAIIYMVYEYTIHWLNKDNGNGNGNGNGATHKYKDA